VRIEDPGQISVTGEGIVRGTKGEDTMFSVNAGGVGGNIKVEIEGGFTFNRPGLYSITSLVINYDLVACGFA